MKQTISFLALTLLSFAAFGQNCNVLLEDFEAYGCTDCPVVNSNNDNWAYFSANSPQSNIYENWNGGYYVDVSSNFSQGDDMVNSDLVHIVNLENAGIVDYTFEFYDECGRLSVDFLESYESDTDFNSMGRYFLNNGDQIVIDSDSYPFCQDLQNDFNFFHFRLDFLEQTLSIVCPNGMNIVRDFKVDAFDFYGVAFGSNQCGFISNICVTNETSLVDNDGDTYLSNVDCDDNDPNVNPGMVEVPYNGKDDDCDPLTLEDDLDSDGFLIEVDCDDMDSEINPGAVEISDNGVDEDCDGIVGITSVVNLGAETINIYPVPTTQYVYVDSVEKDLSLKVYGLDGSLVLTTRGLTVDMGEVMAGTYVLIIENSKLEKVSTKILLYK